MVAGGAHLRSGRAYDDMAAVGALPDGVAVLREHLLVKDVLEKSAVALLVVLLDGAHQFELLRDLVESLLAGLLRHPGVHVGPLEVLSVGRVVEVGDGAGHGAAVEVLEPYLGVLLLVGGGLLEEGGYLYESVLLGLGSVVSVFVAGHGLACERLLEVAFGLRSFQFGHGDDV